MDAMIELALPAFALVLLLFGVISGRIDRLLVTAPMFFIAAGLVLGGTNVFPPEMGLNEDAILLLAELVASGGNSHNG
jgi:NhaP-type Na+/H+ or K+/H+ antiporter